MSIQTNISDMSLRLKDPYELMYGDRVKEEEDEEDEEEGEEPESGGNIKKKRRPANLCISCPVCGGPAPDHVHFGGKTEETVGVRVRHHL